MTRASVYGDRAYRTITKVVLRHDHIYGGVLEPLPVQRVVDLDAAEAYVLGDVSPPDEERPRRLSAPEVLVRSFATSRYARLPEPERLVCLGQRVVVLPGASAHGIDIRDFSHTSLLIGQSYRLTTEQLRREGAAA